MFSVCKVKLLTFTLWCRFNEAEALITTLKEEKKILETVALETEAANQVLRDEHQALQIPYDYIEVFGKSVCYSFAENNACENCRFCHVRAVKRRQIPSRAAIVLASHSQKKFVQKKCKLKFTFSLFPQQDSQCSEEGFREKGG